MKASSRLIAFLMTILIVAVALFSFACAPINDAVLATTPEPAGTATPMATPILTAPATPTPIPPSSPSPVPPESLTYKQKSDMIGNRASWYSTNYPNPSWIYVFYLEYNGQGRLVWTKKESHQSGNGFDLLDVFNEEALFHVSIEPRDQGKVTPSDFPKYVDWMNESLRQYNIVAAGKLIEINELYKDCQIDFSGKATPYDTLSKYLKKTQTGFIDWTRDELLDAYIDATPAQYILPIWEYIPNAVTPFSYFNPPSPTPVLTPTPTVSPIPDSYKDQVLPLLGIDQDFEEAYILGNIYTYYYLFNGSKRIIWAISYYGTPEGTYDVHSLFNGEYLFSIFIDWEYNPGTIMCLDEWKYHSASSPMLEGVQLLGSGTLFDIIYNYENWGVAYPGNELLDKLQYDSRYDGDAFEADSYIPLTKDEIIDLYMRLTPLEYIPPYWEYVPNAVTPDGFYTPDPVSSSTIAP